MLNMKSSSIFSFDMPYFLSSVSLMDTSGLIMKSPPTVQMTGQYSLELRRILNPVLKFSEVCRGDKEDQSIKENRFVQSAYMPKHVIRFRKK